MIGRRVKTKVSPIIPALVFLVTFAADPLFPSPACAIQTCLSQTSYNQEKCASYVTALYKCCANFYDQVNAGEYKNLSGIERQNVKDSTACPLENVVRRKIKELEKQESASS